MGDTTLPATDKLVVLFPGFGYGADKPLLYYAARVARQKGIPVLTVVYTSLASLASLEKTGSPAERAAQSLPGCLADAEAQIPVGCGRYLLVAKSFGTLVSGLWAKRHPENQCRLFQLTPLPQGYEPVYRGVPAFAATGTADPLGSEAFRRRLAADPAIDLLVVEGGNHSLDTPSDYTQGLSALKAIIETYQQQF